MRLTLTRLSAYALGFLLLGVTAVTAGSVAGPAPSESGGFHYACPGGNGSFSADGVCADTLAHPVLGLDAPAVAVHPVDEGTWAVAARATAQRSGHLVVFTTTNAGENWTRHVVPRSTEFVHDGYYSPRVAFDADGRVHVTAIADGWTTPRSGLVHAVADSAGAAFSGPEILVMSGKRMLSGSLSVTADGAVVQGASLGDVTEVFVLEDGAWHRTRVPGCRLAAHHAEAGAGPVIACQPWGNTTRIHQWEGAEVTPPLLGETALHGWLRAVAASPDGALTLFGSAGEMRHSPDGGLTWQDAADVRDIVGTEWRMSLSAAAADGTGNAHLLVSEFAFRHVALDPATGRVLADTPLPMPPGHATCLVTAHCGIGTDISHGGPSLAFGPGGGVLAWPYKGYVHVTRLVPHVG